MGKDDNRAAASESISKTMGPRDLAAELGVSTWTIYEQIKAGTLGIPYIKVGKKILFSRVVVDRIFNGGSDAA